MTRRIADYEDRIHELTQRVSVLALAVEGHMVEDCQPYSPALAAFASEVAGEMRRFEASIAAAAVEDKAERERGPWVASPPHAPPPTEVEP